MGKKHLLFKSKFIRKKLVAKRLKRYYTKYLLIREKNSFKTKFKIMLKSQNWIKKNYISRIDTRCINSNYPRAVVKFGNLSKAEFKKNVSLSTMTGFTKSSW